MFVGFLPDDPQAVLDTKNPAIFNKDDVVGVYPDQINDKDTWMIGCARARFFNGRGIVGESLTPDVAIRYACAFASTLPEGPIVITRDGRATGRMLASALFSGLCAVGRDVIDVDIAATPTTGVLVRRHGAAGGIQISASHNPPP